MKSTLWLFLILCFASADLKPRKGSGQVCTFKDKSYRPGDSWHPHLEPFGYMFCVRCVCTEAGHVRCHTLRCPALSCANPVAEPQKCCPRCADEPRIPAGLRASARTCRHNGTVYQPGDTFIDHGLFPSKHSNQCVMCLCSNGNIFCALKTCQPITCSSPVSLPDTCCLVCKDHSTGGSSSGEDGNHQLNRGVRHSVDQCSGEQGRLRSDRATPPKIKPSARARGLSRLNLRGASETSVKILLQRKHQRVCLYNGQTYSHGDMWHPVLGKVLECILCTCIDGLQDCRRVSCPSQYPCHHPTQEAGKCCKTCPESQAEANQTQCYSGYKNNLLVYKVELSMKVDSPNTVRIIAVERQNTEGIEVQAWKSIDGVSQIMEIGDIQRKDVVDHPENYTVLTIINEEVWRKFKELGQNLSKAPQTTLCQKGIRDIVAYLNPRQTESRCSP